ncbi:proteasome assembly chaperone family protein [Haloplanus halobius]|uniref:proteasome assembly chaperone family protein n=1 Tax=Haloplanus halobius TaxID=2934938 RepID=UPI00200FA871|nr:PAC2 family protein [Haloplanus sp. XH21]
MERIEILRDDVSLDSPTLIEGLPGVGLVGKLATDHLSETLDMVHYANVHCERLPPVATYQEERYDLATPVRLYADPERDLLALRSDVPVSPEAALEFGDCFEGWPASDETLPIYLSGLGEEREETASPSMYGIGTGGMGERLEAEGIAPPPESGLVSGPTGALLSRAVRDDDEALGLVVECDPRFPDPESAAKLIQEGISPLLGIDVPVTELTERAEEIQQAKHRLAQQMQEADETSSQARPLGMYQ